MKAGKDFLSDKPAMTTLAQLAEVRKVQAETKRIYSVMYSERHENRATVKAGDLVKAGAIGKVIQTVGLGPHRESRATPRPDWFYVKEQVRRHPHRHRLAPVRSVPVLHRVDQGQDRRVAGRQPAPPRQAGPRGLRRLHAARQRRHRLHPRRLVHAEGPATWGDGRLTILGTDGFIEIRKNVDIAGRRAAATSSWSTRRRRATSTARTCALPFAGKLIDDVLNRTETSMPQKHTLPGDAAGARSRDQRAAS